MNNFQCKNLLPLSHICLVHIPTKTPFGGHKRLALAQYPTWVLCSDSHRLTDEISDHPHIGKRAEKQFKPERFLTVMENPLNIRKEKRWKILASKSFALVRYSCLLENKNIHDNRVPWTLVHLSTRPGLLTAANKHLPSFVIMSW